MNFGVISLPQLNKHSLGLLNFLRGILVFLPGLVFFLGSTEQYKAMKIGITFFGSILDLWCISKVLNIFCVFSKFRLERRRSRGHVACSPSARGSLSVWGSRAGALGERPGGVLGARPTRGAPGRGSRGSATRDTWRAREHPGDSPGRGTRGQVSCSEDSRIWLTGWTLGDRWRTRRHPEEVSRREYSGTGVTFGGFRGNYHLWGSRRTRELPGGLRLRYLGHGSCSEGGSGRGFQKWHVPKEAFGLGFGASVVLRGVPKGVPAKASKVHSAGL